MGLTASFIAELFNAGLLSIFPLALDSMFLMNPVLTNGGHCLLHFCGGLNPHISEELLCLCYLRSDVISHSAQD